MCNAKPFKVEDFINCPAFKLAYTSCNKKILPEACGAAIDVPLNTAYPVAEAFEVEKRFTPTATRSGLIRPSSVGPQLLKLEILILDDCAGGIPPVPEIAPTVRIFLAVEVVERMS